MMQNKIIWMMGGSGSGKSVAAEIMRNMGIYVLDADSIAHSVLEKGEKAYKEVIDTFGTSFLTENDEINRRALGKLVFSDKEKLALLNQITHKYIKEKILSLLNHNGATVIDAPLPPDEFIKCDKILYITASRDIRISRISVRDSIDSATAENRLNSQKYIDDYIKNADTVIENNGSKSDLEIKIRNWCIDEKIS